MTEKNSLLPGAKSPIETKRKLVTTKVGDEGTTSLGTHGFVSKGDWRVELLGALDNLKTYMYGLPSCPEWIVNIVDDIMVAMVKETELQHVEKLKIIEKAVVQLRDKVHFTEKGWFKPANEAGHAWDVFRNHVREAERIAWRVYEQSEAKERAKGIAQLLNRLGDFAYVKMMAHSQEKA